MRRAQLPRPQARPVRVQPLLPALVPQEPLQAPHRCPKGCPLQVHEASLDVHVQGRGVVSSRRPPRPAKDRQKSTDPGPGGAGEEERS